MNRNLFFRNYLCNNSKNRKNIATFFLKAIFYIYGSVIVNLDPMPNSLSAEIVPLLISVNSLHKSNPNPVPFSSSVPKLELLLFTSNK